MEAVMAWYEKGASGNFFLFFRLGNRRFARTLKTTSEKEAKSAVGVVEENIRLLERGRLEIPKGADVVSFLLSNGKIAAPISVSTLTLHELFRAYFAAIPEGSLEDSTVYTIGIHRKWLEGHFGKRAVESIDHAALQNYVSSRSVQPVTIRKELATLRTVWNFGVASKLIQAPYPTAKLKFPKGEEKPPFMPFSEVWNRTKGQASELWECCYLTKDDLRELLRHVKKVGRYRFLHPLFMTAAYTGARRSELARANVCDVSDVLTIHERKRSREKTTTRRVPLTPELRRVLRAWIKGRDGSLFVHDGQPLACKAMAYHFGETLSGSKWQHLRGWHCFRHSMASILASDGVDQRIIDEILGHQTVEMQRRYRHLFPDKIKASVVAVFC
jgi:integrase